MGNVGAFACGGIVNPGIVIYDHEEPLCQLLGLALVEGTGDSPRLSLASAHDSLYFIAAESVFVRAGTVAPIPQHLPFEARDALTSARALEMPPAAWAEFAFSLVFPGTPVAV